jgi:hypothetical protein
MTWFLSSLTGLTGFARTLSEYILLSWKKKEPRPSLILDVLFSEQLEGNYED